MLEAIVNFVHALILATEAASKAEGKNDGNGYRGAHSTFSGFNDRLSAWLRAEGYGETAREVTDAMADAKQLRVFAARRGVKFYLPIDLDPRAKKHDDNGKPAAKKKAPKADPILAQAKKLAKQNVKGKKAEPVAKKPRRKAAKKKAS